MSSVLPLEKGFYFTAIDGIASFPDVMVAIRDAIQDPTATPISVGKAVERDVAFTSRLLRIVNAPAVGLVRPCASIPHAVTLVGLQKIGMHAEKAASLAALSQCASIAPDLAARSAVEAAIARTIATQVGMSPDHAFTAALLADVGTVAILATQPHWDAGVSRGEEQVRLGFDHADLGADILQRWHLPDPIPHVVRHHHDLEAAIAKAPDIGRYVAILQAAEYLAPGVKTDEEPNIDEWDLIAEHPALEHLEIDAVKLARIWPDLLTGVEAEANGTRMDLDSEREERPRPVKRKKSRRSFYVAMAAAVVIPAAVGFQLFYR